MQSSHGSPIIFSMAPRGLPEARGDVAGAVLSKDEWGNEELLPLSLTLEATVHDACHTCSVDAFIWIGADNILLAVFSQTIQISSTEALRRATTSCGTHFATTTKRECAQV